MRKAEVTSVTLRAAKANAARRLSRAASRLDHGTELVVDSSCGASQGLDERRRSAPHDERAVSSTAPSITSCSAAYCRRARGSGTERPVAVGDHHGLVDQGRDLRRPGRVRSVADHRSGCRRGRSGRRTPKGAKRVALIVGEQTPAPVDRGTHGRVSLDSTATTGRQHVDVVVQSGGDVAGGASGRRPRRARSRAGCRPVATDLTDGAVVLDREPGTCGDRPGPGTERRPRSRHRATERRWFVLPRHASGSRLVVTIASDSQLRSSSVLSPPTPSSTCSQLSSTSNTLRAPIAVLDGLPDRAVPAWALRRGRPRRPVRRRLRSPARTPARRARRRRRTRRRAIAARRAQASSSRHHRDRSASRAGPPHGASALVDCVGDAQRSVRGRQEGFPSCPSQCGATERRRRCRTQRPATPARARGSHAGPRARDRGATHPPPAPLSAACRRRLTRAPGRRAPRP